MAWTSPATYSAGEIVTAAKLNTHVRDNLKILGAGARVYRTTNQSISDATWTAVGFDSERYDPDGFHDPGSNTRLTVPATFSGRYLLWFGFITDAAGGADWGTRFLLNGTTVIGMQELVQFDISLGSTNTTVYALVAGDYVEAQVRHTFGSALNVLTASAYSPEFAIQGLGG